MVVGILAFIDKNPTLGRWFEYPKMGAGVGSLILHSFTYLLGYKGTNSLGC